jgi:hypothetical protein
MRSIRKTFVVLLALMLAAIAAQPQSLSTNSAPSTACAASSDSPKEAVHFPSYFDESIQQLKTEVPALRGLKAGAVEKGSEVTPQDETASILSQTGAAIAAMLLRIPNLVANEEVSEAQVPLPYMAQDAQRATSTGKRLSGPSEYSSTARPVDGEQLQQILHDMLDTSQTAKFSYRIKATPDPVIGAVLEEYRTNAENQSVIVSSLSPGNPNGVGFSNSWLLLLPANQTQSHFRYLGRQKINQHDTVVLAYAQDPKQVLLPAEIETPGGSCAFFTQGVIWIAQSTYQVVRLQTDLLSPLSAINLQQLRSELLFTEVRIPERNLSLWLPSEVEISWRTKDQAGGELHRYSKYKLFTATGRMLIPEPN